MVSVILRLYIPYNIILDHYIVQYSHFAHSLQEHYLVDTVPHLFQHKIFED